MNILSNVVVVVLIVFGAASFSAVSAHGSGGGMHGSMMDDDDMQYGMMRRGRRDYGMMMGNNMMGPGMMGGSMMGGGILWHGVMMGRGMMMLDLNEGQRQQLRQIQRKQRKSMFLAMETMMEAHDELEELYAKDEVDEKAILAIYDKKFSVMKKMIASSVKARNTMMKMLTEEQRKQLKKGYMQMGRGMMR